MRHDLLLCSMNERLGVIARHLTGKAPPGVDLAPFDVDGYLVELYEYGLANARELKEAMRTDRREPDPPRE